MKKKQLEYLDLLEQTLNAMTELISNWTQLNDKQRLELLKQRREEIRENFYKNYYSLRKEE